MMREHFRVSANGGSIKLFILVIKLQRNDTDHTHTVILIFLGTFDVFFFAGVHVICRGKVCLFCCINSNSWQMLRIWFKQATSVFYSPHWDELLRRPTYAETFLLLKNTHKLDINTNNNNKKKEQGYYSSQNLTTLHHLDLYKYSCFPPAYDCHSHFEADLLTEDFLSHGKSPH